MPRLGKSKSTWVTYAIEAAIIVLALLLGLAIRHGVYDTVIVISRSMEPTLLIGDRLLIDHRNSLHGNWRRGDIVLFFPPSAWGEPDRLIKRVIGLPGETIEIQPGSVAVNGRALNEEYIAADVAASVVADPEEITNLRLTLGAGQYFVMGDNRSNSADSRLYGPISDSGIYGRVARRLGPVSRWGKLPTPAYQRE